MFLRALTLLASAVLAGSLLAPTAAFAADQPPVDDAPTTMSTTGFNPGVTRLAGDSRYETALAISQRYTAGVPAVFVATGSNFPDALSAAAAASLVGGPLLLTPSDSLPKNVREEIQRLKPMQIYIIGGPGAVSGAVFNALKPLASKTTRLGGADRYETARTIIKNVFTSSGTALIATGRTFPDALAATGAAGVLNAPVVLVDGVASKIPDATVKLLRSLGVRSITIAGGPGAVSTGVESHAKALGFTVQRLGGASRYDTAAAINNAYFPAGSSSTMFLATGTNFPDALAGAALAGNLGAPVYVTQATCAPKPIRESVSRLGASRTVVLGGTSVVSDASARNTECAQPRPERTKPIDGWTCPTWAPIKGNASSMIYHVPGGAFYEKTNPEECFANEGAAQRAGYRKSKL
ncbi:cell wall-binding repeat-containing protein [Microbacterium sp. A84]|uniref:cell wall-binding repeat-containing protein n=1 Tax=Microbacterium sp. A84 TaxID=3450715 RepID=UPI003F434D07